MKQINYEKYQDVKEQLESRGKEEYYPQLKQSFEKKGGKDSNVIVKFMTSIDNVGYVITRLYVFETNNVAVGSPTINDIVDAIDNINEDIVTTTQGYDFLFLHLESNGSVSVVKFGDLVLWDSENDERNYVLEEIDLKESIEHFLRHELQKIVNVIAKIRVGVECNDQSSNFT